MRLRVRHTTHYRFDAPARNITHILRLTPRSYEGQHVVGWRIDVDTDCTLKADEDGFGNITHSFTVKGPCEDLTISVGGEIENFDTIGIVRGSAERLPVELYLRDTPLTATDPALRAFGETAVEGHSTGLDRLHALLEATHREIVFNPEKEDAESAALAFAAKQGSARDVAHVFTSCARHLGYPARLASGYYMEGEQMRGVGHVWSEAHVPKIGWIGFDAAHKICPHERHVRVAMGLDGLSAAPVRGTRTEGLTEVIEIVAA